MAKNKNLLIPISILIGSIFISFGLFLGLSNQATGSVKADLIAKAEEESVKEDTKLNPLLEITEDDHIFGNPEAPISLIEYSDFECPYCKRFHITPELLVEEFKGKVNWVYRHYPLSFHDPAATLEASAAECANEQGGNEAFWNYAELIYENTAGNGKGTDKDRLIAMAGEIELDESSFKECLDSNKFKDRIKQDFKNGSKLGVSGTPATFVVNHVTGESELVSGAQPFDSVKSIIEEIM